MRLHHHTILVSSSHGFHHEENDELSEYRPPVENGTQLTDMDCTDNIPLLAQMKENLQDMMVHLERDTGKIGLRINSDKMKMKLVGNIQMNTPIVIGCQPIEDVQHFIFLGSILSSNGNFEGDISCQIGKTSSVFQRLHLIWSVSTIGIKTKIWIYNSLDVAPVI